MTSGEYDIAFVDVKKEGEEILFQDDSLPDLIEFVRLVRENPLLWDQSHPKFKDRDQRDVEWSLLGTCLTKQLSGDEAKRKFYNLRSTFGKLYKKVRNSEFSSGTSENHTLYKPDWPLYEDMLFLRDVIRPRRKRYRMEEKLLQLESCKQKKVAAKTCIAKSICNSALPANSTAELLEDNICNDRNNVSTQQCLPKTARRQAKTTVSPSAEDIGSQAWNVDLYDPLADKYSTDAESAGSLDTGLGKRDVTPPPDASYKKKKENDEALFKTMREMVSILKSLANSTKQAQSPAQSQPSTSGSTLNPVAEAFFAFIKESLSKVKEEDLLNCFQDIISVIRKYPEK